jgi:hypothetical protein
MPIWRSKLERDGAILVSRPNRHQLVIQCACGALETKFAANLNRPETYARCRACGLLHLRNNPKGKISVREARSYVLSSGCYPLFMTLPPGTKVPCQCYCGRQFKWDLDNRFRKNKPRCLDCSHRSKRKHGAISSPRGHAFERWAIQVLKQANFTCVISGVRGKALSAHHLYNRADYPDRRFDISNGVAILRELHLKFHRQYGRKNNTPEQFMEFLNQERALNATCPI